MDFRNDKWYKKGGIYMEFNSANDSISRFDVINIVSFLGYYPFLELRIVDSVNSVKMQMRNLLAKIKKVSKNA